MSENQIIDPDRQIRLKEIIHKLHGGASASEVKREFAKLIQGVSAAEVAAMEQSLIDGGMPVEEVQRLCEVHVQVFETSLARGERPAEQPGHPVHTLLAENNVARRKARALKAAARAWSWGLGDVKAAERALDDLSKIIIHYTRKENQLFPYLEHHKFTGPSRVMWGKHDEIRALFRDAREALARGPGAFRPIANSIAGKVQRMIFMEERILVPESVRKLSEREWALIRKGEDAIGFAWIEPESLYDAALVLAKTRPQGTSNLEAFVAAATATAPQAVSHQAATSAATPVNSVPPAEGGANSPVPKATSDADVKTTVTSAETLLELATGLVPLSILDTALKTLPIDISIVDDQDRVLYYSDAPHRIFPRSPAVIGRSVQNCHPQKSVDTVNKILDAFRKKERSKARFWIQLGGKFILIEYYALYGADGSYRGTLEVSQDLTELRALEGQNRLLDWS